MSAENVKRVLDAIEAFNRGDIDAAMADYHETLDRPR